MIQRIQTLFLLLAAAVMGVLLVPSLSFVSYEGNPEVLEGPVKALLADQVYNVYDQSVLLGITGVAAILALATIFLFKNRPLQMRLNQIGMAAGILILLLAAIFFYPALEESELSVTALSPGLGIGIPVLFIIFLFMASRNIRKDEKLVRSMDRLR